MSGRSDLDNRLVIAMEGSVAKSKILKQARFIPPLKERVFSRQGIKISRSNYGIFPDNYDCTPVWDPENNHFGCSATISALYGKFGSGIGREFSKIDENVTPVDFFHSQFFTFLYAIGN
jgi:hypothetical protein